MENERTRKNTRDQVKKKVGRQVKRRVKKKAKKIHPLSYVIWVIALLAGIGVGILGYWLFGGDGDFPFGGMIPTMAVTDWGQSFMGGAI